MFGSFGKKKKEPSPPLEDDDDEEADEGRRSSEVHLRHSRQISSSRRQPQQSTSRSPPVDVQQGSSTGFLSRRLAASLNEPSTTSYNRSGSSRTDYDSDKYRDDGGAVKYQGRRSRLDDYNIQRQESKYLKPSIKRTESRGFTNEEDPDSECELTNRSHRKDEIHSKYLVDDKRLKSKSSRSSTSGISPLSQRRNSTYEQQDQVRSHDNDKRSSHSSTKDPKLQNLDRRNNNDTGSRSRHSSHERLQFERASSKHRSLDELNNNPRRSRHSSRETAKSDSSSKVKLTPAPGLTERLSRHSSQIRPTSSRRSSVMMNSRDNLPPPFDMSGTKGDINSIREYLARSSSIGSRRGRGPGESTIGLEPEPETPQPIARKPFKILVHRKTTALSMAIMTLALLSGSASQLRFMMAYASAHQYPELNYVLICMSIAIEVIAGTGYVILSRFDFSEECVERTHSYLIFGLFLIAVSNVIIAAFALDDHVCELLQKSELDYIDQEPPPKPSSSHDSPEFQL